MIYVCMGQNDSIQFTDRHRKRSVLYRRLAPLSLEHPAVERHCTAIDVQQVARARYLTGRTGKRHLQMSSALCDGTSREQDRQALLILRHERRLPAAAASLIEEISEGVFVFTRVAGELYHYSLVFFHADGR